jgi:hypothetical protein
LRLFRRLCPDMPEGFGAHRGQAYGGKPSLSVG